MVLRQKSLLKTNVFNDKVLRFNRETTFKNQTLLGYAGIIFKAMHACFMQPTK